MIVGPLSAFFLFFIHGIRTRFSSSRLYAAAAPQPKDSKFTIEDTTVSVAAKWTFGNPTCTYSAEAAMRRCRAARTAWNQTAAERKRPVVLVPPICVR